MKALAIVLVLGCSRRAPVASCDDDLGGVWRDGESRRWFVIDSDAGLEIYPAFADVGGAPAGTFAAPRVMDLSRVGAAFGGVVHRRFERGGQTCDARAPVTITACRDDGLDLVVGEPPVCPDGGAAPPRIERWRRD